MDSLSIYFLLSIFSLITSLITAIIGMGGGILLLALLPGLIPVNALIPVHGAVQLSSNFSRFVFDIKHTCLKPLIHFFIGSILGSYFGSRVLILINLEYIPLIMSVFILVILWLPIKKILLSIPGRYFSLGIVQTGLSLYVGATGPLSTSFLVKEGYSSREVIVTNAAINTLINIAKIIVFSSLGFVFYEYLIHITMMSIFAILGSYLGTRYRKKVNVELGRKILLYMVSILCIKNIFYSFY
ncbi:sulfite exporter TauE/SafE family protein [Marinomonas sp. PE14-40]|uniref:sulfite exporter TauE/SafE family protein n=1 Tax=Marinomonas sp. PE14-40 TaxID=3060621 RepID=UPI003F678F37